MLSFIVGLVVGAVIGAVVSFLFTRKNPKVVSQAESVVKTVEAKTAACCTPPTAAK
jgi:gas vesicle protein